MHLSDVVRAKVLHWHKATFFPDFMPARDEHGDDDDIGSEGEHEVEEGEEEEPSTARRMAYGATTTLVLALLCSARTLLDLLTSIWPALFGRFTGVCGRVQFRCGLDGPSGNCMRSLSFFNHTPQHDQLHDTHTPYLHYHAQITMYMAAQPHVYSPLGTLGARLLSYAVTYGVHVVLMWGA